VEVQRHVFVTSVLNADGWIVSRPDRLHPGEESKLLTA